MEDVDFAERGIHCRLFVVKPLMVVMVRAMKAKDLMVTDDGLCLPVNVIEKCAFLFENTWNH